MSSSNSESGTSGGDGRARRPSAPRLDFATLAAMVQQSPFHQWLGVQLTTLDAEGVELLMPWRAEFVSDATIGYTHGGILAAFIDLAADYAIAAVLGRGAPTVDLRTDYHKAAMPGPLTAKARVIKVGGTLATAEASLYDGSQALIASGRGVFLTLQRGGPPHA